MACTVDFCVSSIVDQDTADFDLLLQKLVQEINGNRRSKAILKFKWVFDIPVFCTLCNNPGFIMKVREFRRQLHNVVEFYGQPCLGHNFTVLDLANALKYDECSKELKNLYVAVEIDSPKVDDFGIYAAVLNTGKIYKILVDYGVTVRTVRRLSDNGLDISARGPSGRSVLHEAIIHMSSYEMYQTIFSLGGDVNSTDYFGTSAFSSFVLKAVYYKCSHQEVIKILKLFLFQNPSLAANLGVVKTAIKYDRLKFPDISGSENVPEDHDQTGQRAHPNEELRLLPWLYKCGFPISQADRDDIELPGLFGDTVTYNLRLDCPRELRDIARIKIRMTYTGKKLHNITNSIKIPSSVKDYILMKDIMLNLTD